MPVHKSSVFEGIDLSNIDKVVQELDDLRKQIADGLLDELLQINDEEHYTTLKQLVGEDFNRDNLRKKVEAAMQSVTTGSGTLKDAFGITSEGMESFYFIGHSMFERHNYPAARRMFQFLIQLDPLEPKYHHALGSTQHKQKDFLAAAQSYMSAFALSPVNNPELHYHCADCFLKMDDTLSAIVSLGHCIEACDERNPLHRQIKMRSVTLRETLIKSLKEEETQKQTVRAQQEQTMQQALQAESSLTQQKPKDSKA